MSKITVLEAKTYQGKPQGFKVTFDDGRNGNLNEKESDKGLKVGDDVVVTEIPYTSAAGKKSTLYGVKVMQQSAAQSSQSGVTPPPRPQIHVGAGKSIQELKTDAAVSMMTECLKLFAIDKLDGGQIANKQKELSLLLWSEIDDIFLSSPK